MSLGTSFRRYTARMTLRFIDTAGQTIKEPVHFGPGAVVPLPTVGDFIEVLPSFTMHVVERRFAYLSPKEGGLSETIVDLVLAWSSDHARHHAPVD